VLPKLKTPWRDGTTHLVKSPLEFMQRLPALVPRPRLHLIRFGGVLAPNAKLRAMVLPQEPEAPAQEAKPAACGAGCAHHRPVRLSWARLLKRVFALDLEHCPNCGGELKIIATILEQPVIERSSRTWVCRPGRRHAHPPAVKRCKRLDDSDPSLFMRHQPRAAGIGRAGLSTSRSWGQVTRVNQQPRPLVCAFDRDQRHAAGRHRNRQRGRAGAGWVERLPHRPPRGHVGDSAQWRRGLRAGGEGKVHRPAAYGLARYSGKAAVQTASMAV
jgi:hypothetical protein